MTTKVRLRARGPFALFTRPEFKVERVTYDVITPTAAQGLFESILWKPEIEWHIHRIEVINPIKFQLIRRNEVKNCFPMRLDDELPRLNITEDRIQRYSLLLRDVDYVIEATLSLSEIGIQSKQESIKYMEMFRRRLRKGQNFRVPYFGCREYVADITTETENVQTLAEDKVLGSMPLRMKWTENGPEPIFFAAHMTNGVIVVPKVGQET